MLCANATPAARTVSTARMMTAARRSEKCPAAMMRLNSSPPRQSLRAHVLAACVGVRVLAASNEQKRAADTHSITRYTTSSSSSASSSVTTCGRPASARKMLT